MSHASLRKREIKEPDALGSELLAYCENKFKDALLAFDPSSLPASDEPCLLWQAFLSRAHGCPVGEFLRENWIAFQFPIKKGISQSPPYLAATLKGRAPQPSSAPLTLPEAESIDFFLYNSPAGNIPVLQFADEEDFVRVVQALAFKNEPLPVPESMGAGMIRGINNWSRIAKLKAAWQQASTGSSWAAFFKAEILPHKAKYQDQVILLSKKPYSGIPAQQLGLDEKQWLDLSSIIRLEHECSHLFTANFLGGMYVNMHDELIADYMGITQALGFFDPVWFLTFLGLETEAYRKGGRLENYTGKAGLSAASFRQLQDLLRTAADQLSAFDEWAQRQDSPDRRLLSLLTLASLSLRQIGSVAGGELMQETYARLYADMAAG